MTPQQQFDHIAPSAEAFANKVLDLNRGFAVVAFEHALVVYMSDAVPQFADFRKKLLEITKETHDSATVGSI